MATPPNLTQIAFSGGLDESVHGEVLDPSTSFRVLQNGRQDRQGGYGKRLGTAALNRSRLIGAARSAGASLASFRGAPCIFDGGTLDVYAEELGASVSAGRVPDCNYKLGTLPSLSKSSTVTDVEYMGGFLAIGWTNGAAVVARATGTMVGAPLSTTSTLGYTSVASFSGRYFVAALFNGTAGSISLYIFDTQTPSMGWVSLASLGSGTAIYVSIASAGDRVIIIFSTTGGVFLRTYNQTGMVGSAVLSSVTTATFVDVSMSADKSVVWAAYFGTTTMLTLAVRSVLTLTTTIAADATNGFGFYGPISVVPGDTNASAQVFVSTTTGSGAGFGNRVMQATATIAASAISWSTTTINGGVRLSGKGIRNNGRTLIPVYGSPDQSSTLNVQGTLTIVDATDASTNTLYPSLVLRPVANIEPGVIATGQASLFNKLSPSGTGRIYVAFSTYSGGGFSRLYSSPSETPVATNLAELSFVSTSRWETAEHAGSLFIGGAVLSVFDGSNVTEAGIIVAPCQPLPVAGAAGLPNGTYRYVATYEDVDASGHWVVSGVSAPSSPVVVTSKQIRVWTNPLSVTSRTLKATSRVCFYRTTTGGNPPYYRVGSITNDQSYDQLSFLDNVLDAELASLPKLYAPSLPGTTGESLDRRAPPGLVDVVSYNGMLVGVKGSSVVYSGQPVYGEATWFNPVFEIPVYGGGDFVGLDVLDGVLFLFKSTRIFSLSGTPPTDSGSNLGLGDPLALASDVGCIDANSIVSTSAGIFFQSARGIELLDRSGAVTFIGFKVVRRLAAFPVVMSARLDARNSLVRFSLASAVVNGAVLGAGVDVVYDLKLGVWIAEDVKTGQVASEAAQDAAIVTIAGVDRYAWLGVDGFVYVERLATDASAYLDGTSYVARAAETANFRVSGIQGTQHVNAVMFLERRATDHDTSLALAYNYEAAYRTPQVWSAATLAANAWPITQLKHQPHDDAQCQGIRVRIVDAAPSSGTVGNGQGSTWLALSLDITPKPGVFDVPDLST